jgi:hypothetical protein
MREYLSKPFLVSTSGSLINKTSYNSLKINIGIGVVSYERDKVTTSHYASGTFMRKYGATNFF